MSDVFLSLTCRLFISFPPFGAPFRERGSRFFFKASQGEGVGLGFGEPHLRFMSYRTWFMEPTFHEFPVPISLLVRPIGMGPGRRGTAMES